jgi:asparagine synthase (glutamine-hydrolysing)
MCGIFCIVSQAGVDPEKLWLGTHRAQHRGPDDWGLASFLPMRDRIPPVCVWRSWDDRCAAQNYKVGLGSRRLSIFDRSEAGRQPMNLPNSDLWIVFNGAIYNYIELRAELGAEQHFLTGTDTEVLLAAYRKWGTGCLTRLNGMFAFAIWDPSRMKLFMARDRFGEKPLYYLRTKRQFAIASELKQFFDDEDFKKELDHSALADFFLLYLQDHDERTFFTEIKQLPPAHWMELDIATGNLCGPVRYWTPEITDDFDDSNDRSLQENLATLLSDSIRLRLRSDVPIGICLSGGLDSTTICTLAAAEKNSLSLSAYSMAFPGHADDELSAARRLAKHVGVRHLESSLHPGELWEQLAEFAYFQDGPTGGASTVASRKVFEAARDDGTTVLLNGQGGDELFAGYSKFFFFWWQSLLQKGKWLRLVSSVVNYVARNGSRNWSFADARRYAPRFMREKLNGIWSFALPEFRRKTSLFVNTRADGCLNRRLWKDLSELSLPSLLHWEDRNSMSVGAEARLPFLDHRLVEAVLKTSVNTKLSHGFTKYSLRKAMTQLPAVVRWQKKKRGFETPARQWFANDLAHPLRCMLARDDSPVAEFFDVKAISRHLGQAGNDNNLTANDLFKLAALNVWLEQLRQDSNSLKRSGYFNNSQPVLSA